MTILKVSS